MFISNNILIVKRLKIFTSFFNFYSCIFCARKHSSITPVKYKLLLQYVIEFNHLQAAN